MFPCLRATLNLYKSNSLSIYLSLSPFHPLSISFTPDL